MNICIVSNFKQSGYGESTRPGQMAAYLKLFGHNILHICDWQGTENGIKHIHIERETWEPNVIKRLVTFASDYTSVKLFNPDLIYAHQFNNVKWALQTKLFAGTKIVFDAHTSKFFEHIHFKAEADFLQLLKTQENDMCHRSDFIIAASQETKDFFVSTYKVNTDKIKVVGNATTIAPVTESYTTKNEKFICLATLPQDGFVSNEMALDMLQDIAVETFKHDQQILFYVVGGGKMPVAKSPNIVYTGYVENLRETILKADICLMPFPSDAVCGGARNKFCDYIALGKVVVTTPEGLRGMEVLEDKVNCLVAGTVKESAEKICSLATNKEKLTAIEKGVLEIKDYFNWQDRARLVESIFKQLQTK